MLLWLAVVVHNDWETFPVLLGLFVFGVGRGSVVTLVLNVLVTASPRELLGDVGSLRGMANNLAAAVGTAVAGALVIGLLSAGIMRALADNPWLPPEIRSRVDLDSINFVSNDRLLDIMQRTTATPAQIDEALRITTEERLRALKICLLTMAGLALMTIVAAGRLPAYKPGEIQAEAEPRQHPWVSSRKWRDLEPGRARSPRRVCSSSR